MSSGVIKILKNYYSNEEGSKKTYQQEPHSKARTNVRSLQWCDTTNGFPSRNGITFNKIKVIKEKYIQSRK